MSAFLASLAHRALATAGEVRPLVPSLFESAKGGAFATDIPHETGAAVIDEIRERELQGPVPTTTRPMNGPTRVPRGLDAGEARASSGEDAATILPRLPRARSGQATQTGETSPLPGVMVERQTNVSQISRTHQPAGSQAAGAASSTQAGPGLLEKDWSMEIKVAPKPAVPVQGPLIAPALSAWTAPFPAALGNAATGHETSLHEAEPRVIQISIGRLEIRASSAPSAGRAVGSDNQPRAMTLAEYLRRSTTGGGT